jgi:hypothetical protein
MESRMIGIQDEMRMSLFLSTTTTTCEDYYQNCKESSSSSQRWASSRESQETFLSFTRQFIHRIPWATDEFKTFFVIKIISK